MQTTQEQEVCLTHAGAKNTEASERAWDTAALTRGQRESEATGFPSVYWAGAFLQEPRLL